MKVFQLSALILPITVALAAVPSSAEQPYVRYVCESGKTFEAKVLSDKARVKFNTPKSLELLPVDAREGLRFSNGYILLKLNGNQASVEYRSQLVFDQCIAQ